MSPPPSDETDDKRVNTGDRTANDDEHNGEPTPTQQRDKPTKSTDATESKQGDSSEPRSAEPTESDPTEPDESQPTEPRDSRTENPIEHEFEPENVATGSPTDFDGPPASVESNWWYWVAAVPAYFLIGLVGGVAFLILFLLTAVVDVAGGLGIATGLLVLVFGLGAVAYTLAGLVLLIMFPVGIYLDAKAIEASAVDWDPDPVLYGLIAVATALFSALTVSLVIALYYLYRRNQWVGTP